MSGKGFSLLYKDSYWHNSKKTKSLSCFWTLYFIRIMPIIIQKKVKNFKNKVVIQLANIVPLGVTLLNHCCPRYLHLSGLIYSLLTLGVLSQVLLFFYWNVQINEKSIPFFILFFGASVVDCTSSVSFIPFMTRLQTRFLQVKGRYSCSRI